eukprot:756209-Prymnesium_polylepis.1
MRRARHFSRASLIFGQNRLGVFGCSGRPSGFTENIENPVWPVERKRPIPTYDIPMTIPIWVQNPLSTVRFTAESLAIIESQLPSPRERIGRQRESELGRFLRKNDQTKK